MIKFESIFSTETNTCNYDVYIHIYRYQPGLITNYLEPTEKSLQRENICTTLQQANVVHH